jgi:hypothetical protein
MSKQKPETRVLFLDKSKKKGHSLEGHIDREPITFSFKTFIGVKSEGI